MRHGTVHRRTKGAVQLVAKDVGFISDDSGKPTEDTDTHKVRADRYVM